MDAAPAAQHLQYAQQPLWHRRRRWRRMALASLLVLLTAAGFLSWRRWGPRVQARVQMLSAQRACLQFDSAPGTVVFDRDRDAGATYATWMRDGRTVKYVIPPAWTTFHPKYVEPFSPLQSGGLQSHGTLFLHERRSPAGNRRLVTVELNTSWGKSGTWIAMDTRAIIPGTFRTEPKETWGGPPATDLTSTNLVGRRVDMLMDVPYGKALKLFAGHPDPTDVSHFTIDYEIDRRRETIDGRLGDDDSVAMSLRNPADRKPAK